MFMQMARIAKMIQARAMTGTIFAENFAMVFRPLKMIRAAMTAMMAAKT